MSRQKFWAIVVCLSTFYTLSIGQSLADADNTCEGFVSPTSTPLSAAKLTFGAPSKIGTLVVQGSDINAEKYYLRISKTLGFYSKAAGQDNLDFVVQDYFGYAGLQVRDLELLASDILMPRNNSEFVTLADSVTNKTEFTSNLTLLDFANDNVLVSRFLAPKIVDFTNSAAGHFTAGWRKLVRLQAKKGSKAEAAGIKFAHILFNYASDAKFPFASLDSSTGELKDFSKNNQLILEPATYEQCVEDSIYWLVYGPQSDNYKTINALNAAFDFPSFPNMDVTGPQDYFVPTACAQCHGHDSDRGNPIPNANGDNVFMFGKLNYLDTDQWYDSLYFDFPDVAVSDKDVLFDGGKAHNSQKYKAAEAVINRLNRDILKQNRIAEREVDSFQVRAAQKWISLHNSGAGPFPIEERALSNQSGNVWDFDKFEDRELVRMLSRYCFRCHSSMYYNIFDKSALAKRKGAAIFLVENGIMPQGRKLDDLTKLKMIRYLSALQ